MASEISWLLLVAAFLAVTVCCAVLAVRLYGASARQ
jgi:hypothetical protein